MIVLAASSVSKSYPQAGYVLRDVSLSIRSGECVALVGPSGAGKSTLLHCLATLDAPDKGSIQLTTKTDTIDVVALRGAALARVRSAYLGMIYQFHHLLPEFTALENVMISAIIAGESTATAAKRARQLLERVHLAHRVEHYPSQLSGGEQQRVAIARSLMNNPILLFADEPTGNLDSANATDIANLFFELQSEYGLACVIATHSVDLAARCDRTLQMHDGVLIESVA